MTELRFGGRCHKHALNIIPCVQCQAEAIVQQNATRTFLGWALPEQIHDITSKVDKFGGMSLYVSADWQPGRVALYAEKAGLGDVPAAPAGKTLAPSDAPSGEQDALDAKRMESLRWAEATLRLMLLQDSEEPFGPLAVFVETVAALAAQEKTHG